MRSTAARLSLSPATQGINRFGAVLLAASLAVSLIAIAWYPRLSAGLSLDEAGTWWVVRDGWQHVIHRAVTVQGQSPLYYLLVKAVTALVGAQEIALRLPSVVSAAGSAILLFLLGRRWFGAAVGVVAVVFFLAFEPIIVAGATARPYSVAMLCWLGATVALDSWIERHDAATLTFHAVLTVVMVYLHYVFAPALVLHALLLWIRRRDLPPRLWRVLVGWTLAVALALIPVLPQLESLARRRQALTFVAPPSFAALAQAWCPPEFTVAVLLAFALLAIGGSRRRQGSRPQGWQLTFVVAWMLLPPAIAFGASHVAGTPLFFTRYYLVYAPGVALVAALPIARLGSRSWRGIYLAGFAATILIARAMAGSDSDDGWRTGANWIRREDRDRICSLLAVTGFVESQDVDGLNDATVGAFIRSPLEYYGLGGGTALPLGLDSAARRAYAEAAVDRSAVAPCLWLIWRTDPVIHDGRWYPTSPTEVAGWLQRRGFARTDAGPFERVMIARFDRPPGGGTHASATSR
jgi:hypothetical protein